MFKLAQIYKYLFYFSGILLIAGIVSLSVYGLRLGIDFRGGTITELEFKEKPNVSEIREILATKFSPTPLVQESGDRGLIIRTEPMEKEKHDELVAAIRPFGEFEEKHFESIGPVIGADLKSNALKQLAYVSVGILLYISYAFRKVSRPLSAFQMGTAAIIALLHDLLIVLGVFSILGHFKGIEVDSLFVTAMLTVLGFSVHDTIVVFDRIRENMRVMGRESLETIVNHSISQTIVRSLNTSLTVLFVMLAMLIFGGESIKNFALALFIGIAIGTYSSIFVASPTLLLWEKFRKRK